MNLARVLPAALGSVVASAALALTAAGPTAAAPAPTCHGQRATVVGTGHGVLRGTPRRDVFVTNGATAIDAGDGDDLVCVVGAAHEVSVDAGDGDDVVAVQAQGAQVSYRSGRGSDVYRGNGQYDSVRLRPDGHDVVATRGGGDIVMVSPVADVGRPRLSLGGGDDSLYLDLAKLPGTVNAGSGQDTLVVDHASKQRWSFDDVGGRARAGSEVRYRWRGIESFELSGLRAPAIDFTGSDRAETVYLQDYGTQSRELAFRMGGGDDQVTVFARQHGSVDGGLGQDHLTMGVNLIDPRNRYVADLATGQATVVNGDLTSTWALSGLEDLAAASWQSAELRGDELPNVLSAPGSCVVVLDGRGGADTLDASSSGTNCGTLGTPPPARGTTATGGEGDDTMLGGYLDDDLEGGGGTDTANGNGGTDTCVAEVRTACELPTP